MPSVFKCIICPYESNFKNNVKRHILTVHSTYFKCKQCEFHSTSKRYLQNHMNQNHEWIDFHEYLSNPITYPSNLKYIE